MAISLLLFGLSVVATVREWVAFDKRRRAGIARNAVALALCAGLTVVTGVFCALMVAQQVANL